MLGLRNKKIHAVIRNTLGFIRNISKIIMVCGMFLGNLTVSANTGSLTSDSPCLLPGSESATRCTVNFSAAKQNVPIGCIWALNPTQLVSCQGHASWTTAWGWATTTPRLLELRGHNTYPSNTESNRLSGVFLSQTQVHAVSPVPPPAPNSITAGIDGPSMRIQWSVTNGATRYELQRNGSNINLQSPLSNMYSDTSAVAGITYVYRVRACNIYGCSAWKNSSNVVMTKVPDAISASMDGPHVLVSWSASPGATYYVLRRNNVVVVPSMTSTSYLDQSVSPSVTYTYSVQACNANGCSITRSASPIVVPNTIPPSPSSISSNKHNTEHRIIVTWSPSSMATRYELQRNETGIYSGSSTGHNDANVAAGISYIYRVRACNSAGCSAWRAASPITIPHAIPAVPSQIQGWITGPTMVMTWTASANVTHYELQRNGTNLSLANPMETGHSDGTAIAGTTYTYRVRACNSSGCSGWRTHASVVMTSEPQSISVKEISGTVIKIDWTQSLGATYYNIQRNGVDIALMNQSYISYLDSTAVPGGSYLYRIQACNAWGCSGWKQAQRINVSVIPIPERPLNPEAIISGPDIRISWSSVVGAVTYQVNRSGVMVTPSNHTTSYFSDGFAVAGNSYSYYIRSCNVSGCSDWSDGVSVLATRPPYGIAGELVSDNSISISWAAAPGATRYILSRNGNVVTSSNHVGTSFIDSELEMDNQYQYRVASCNVHGCTEWSSSINVSVPVPQGFIPMVPTGLYGVFTNNSVLLLWSPSTYANSYSLVRNGSEVTPGGYSLTGYQDNSVESGGEYVYRVSACRDGLCSEFSNPVPIVVIRRPLNITAITTQSSIIVNWFSVIGADYYLIERNDIELDQRIYSATSYIDSLVEQNTNYTYRVKACNQHGCTEWSDPISVTLADQNPDPEEEDPPSPPEESPINITEQLSQELVSGIVNDYPIMGEPTDSTLAGSMVGHFRVTESGSASYVIPIFSAPGVAGVSPAVAIQYDSFGGNGLLGKGWSISGISSISRCRQTVSQDDQARPITWTHEDRFCLNGQRLVLVNGTSYGMPGSEYRTELDSFSTVFARGGSHGNPDYFEVISKDGSLAIYGGLGDSDAEVYGLDQHNYIDRSKVLTWQIKRFSDSVGNPIIYRYLSGNVKEVLFAYSIGQPEEQYGAKIEFNYTAREDSISYYVSGYKFETTVKLDNIRSYSDGQLLREYSLNYELLSLKLGGISRITGIRECASHGCYPSTIFSWYSPQESTSYNHPIGSLNRPSDDYAILGFNVIDINANGLKDVVWSEYKNGLVSIRYSIDNAVINNGADHSIELTSFISSVPPKLIPLDYNADGRQDLLIYNREQGRWMLFISKITPNGWRLQHQSNINLPFSQEQIYLGDINSDGLNDVLEVNSTSQSVSIFFLSKNVSEESHSSTIYSFKDEITYPIVDAYGNQIQSAMLSFHGDSLGVGDFNGDGKLDLALHSTEELYLPGYAEPEYSSKLAVYVSHEDGFSHYADIYEANTYQAVSNSVVIDINGDGLSDLLFKGIEAWFYVINTGAGFTSPLQLKKSDGTPLDVDSVQLLDVSRNGYADLVWREKEGIWKPVFVRYWVPATNSFSDAEYLYQHASENDEYIFADMTGDSWLNRVVFSTSGGYTGLRIFDPYSQSVGRVIPGSDVKIVKPDLVENITDGLGNKTHITYEPLVRSSNYMPIGDIKIESSRAYYCPQPVLMQANPPYYYQPPCGSQATYSIDVNDFYRQVNKPFEYSNVFEQPANPYVSDSPVLEVLAPIPVVTRVESTSPSASGLPGNIDLTSTSAISYKYRRLRMQAEGRGILGFNYLETIDEQSGVITSTVYRQDWPFIGKPIKTVTRLSSGQILSDASSVWGLEVIDGVDGKRIYQPYVKRSIEKDYLVNSDGSIELYPQKTVTIDTDMYPDGYGNIESVKVTSESADVTIENHTWNEYFPGEWNLQMGRLQRSTVSVKRNDAIESVKQARFEYYQDGILKGLIQSEIEHEGTADELRTDYEYDNSGNIITKTISGRSSVNEVSIRSAINIYDNQGRYLLETSNAAGHKNAVLTRNKYGYPTVTEDENGVLTRGYYDAMGRPYLNIKDTGAWSRIYVKACGQLVPGLSLGCPGFAKFYRYERLGGGSASVEFYDSLNRVVRSAKIGFDGRWILVDTEYDKLGRIKHQSLPFFNNQLPAGWSYYAYDFMGRIIQQVNPDGGVTSFSYRGFDKIITNPLGQNRIETSNGFGQLIEVKDNADGVIRYEYAAFGEILKVTTEAPDASPVTIRMCYDSLGRKIAMHDPNKGGHSTAPASCDSLTGSESGWWHYRYNAFSEIIQQKDAKGQITDTQYDLIGRMIRRTDRSNSNNIESHSRWYYDSDSELGTVGQLTTVVMSNDGSESCSSQNYCQEFQYDEQARLVATLTLLPDDSNGYLSSIKYDTVGRAYEYRDAMNGLVFADSGYQMQYNQYGYVYRTVDIVPRDGSSGVLHLIKSVNAQGQITEEWRGNGVTTYNEFDNASGRLRVQRALDPLGLGYIQHNIYNWDIIGNLYSRQSRGKMVGGGHRNLDESFCYDSLNRLVSSYRSPAPDCGPYQDVHYDGLGNIQYKKGVGHYEYGSNAGPHAVTKAGDTLYQYDLNGNVTNDSRRTLNYTSYDLLKRVQIGINWAEFKYGPDRSRWQRIDQDGSKRTITTYLNDVERIEVVGSGVIEWKRNIGGVILTYKTTANNNLLPSGFDKRYIYADHLGSVDVITNWMAVVTHSMGFDSWGKRRSGDSWNPITANYINGSLLHLGFHQPVTQRGYTNHEMIDSFGLIHMNGRIYDPSLGRFLQADPFIQAIANLQSYNRYSYLWNNPLNATDPSGFFLKELWNLARPFVGLIVAGVMSSYGCAWCGQYAYLWIGGVSGAAGAAANGGNIFYGALTGMVSAAVFNGIGQSFSTKNSQGFWSLSAEGGIGHIGSHALAGGVLNVLQGGKFGHGFVSAGISKGMDTRFNLDDTNGQIAAETVVVAVVGGTVSKATGGKFANGAITAAFGHLFNEMRMRSQIAAAQRMANQYRVQSFGDTAALELQKEYAEYWPCTLENFSCTLSLSHKIEPIEYFFPDLNGVKADLIHSREGIGFDFGLTRTSGTNFSLTLDYNFKFEHSANDMLFGDAFLKGSGSLPIFGRAGVKYTLGADMNHVNAKIGAGFMYRRSGFSPVIGL